MVRDEECGFERFLVQLSCSNPYFSVLCRGVLSAADAYGRRYLCRG